MTTSVAPIKTSVCEVCSWEFDLPASTGPGRKPTICESCRTFYLNPPPPIDNEHCRTCMTSIVQVERPKGLPGRTATFCRSCFQIHKKVYMQEAKRKERAGE